MLKKAKIIKDKDKSSNIILALSCIGLAVSLISFGFSYRSYFVWLSFTYFPLFWALWLISYLTTDFDVRQDFKMKTAWMFNSFAVLSLLISLSLVPKIITARCFVEVADLTAISFLPVSFLIGLLIDVLFVFIDKTVYGGDGGLYILIRSQGLLVYTSIMWLAYSIAGVFQTWIVILGMRHLAARKKKRKP